MDRFFGADYYPEHWKEERWETDFKLMSEAGMNVIRVAEFTWCRMEPEEGMYDFNWLEMIIRLAERYGLKTVLCTPTATPPAWMIEKYKDILPVNEYGKVFGFGNRRHYCPNHKVYQEYSRKITHALAECFGKNESVMAFQIDNELYGATACYCSTCRKEFQSWLMRKYKTLENLNQCWGTIFWSQEYSAWSQIPYPDAYVRQHPSLMLDYMRFLSQSWIGYSNMQAKILRENAPGKIITTNAYLFRWGDDIDYSRLFKELDVYSFDNYSDTMHEGAFYNDFARSIKGGKYWILEQRSGCSGAGQYCYPDEDDRITKYTMQAYEYGCELLTYFRWRQGLFGQEQNNGAVLDHDGKTGDYYFAVKEIGKRLKDYNPEPIREKVGIYYDYQDSWARRIAGWNSYVDYIVNHVYKGLYDAGLNARFIFSPNDVQNMELLILPLKLIHSDELAKNIEYFVKNGGKVLITSDLARKNEYNAFREEKLPEIYRKVLGIDLVKFVNIHKGFAVSAGEGSNYEALWRCDSVKLGTAKRIISFTNGPMEGSPAVTENLYGNGKAYYMAALFTDKVWTELLTKLII